MLEKTDLLPAISAFDPMIRTGVGFRRNKIIHKTIDYRSDLSDHDYGLQFNSSIDPFEAEQSIAMGQTKLKKLTKIYQTSVRAKERKQQLNTLTENFNIQINTPQTINFQNVAKARIDMPSNKIISRERLRQKYVSPDEDIQPKFSSFYQAKKSIIGIQNGPLTPLEESQIALKFIKRHSVGPVENTCTPLTNNALIQQSKLTPILQGNEKSNYLVNPEFPETSFNSQLQTHASGFQDYTQTASGFNQSGRESKSQASKNIMGIGSQNFKNLQQSLQNVQVLQMKPITSEPGVIAPKNWFRRNRLKDKSGSPDIYGSRNLAFAMQMRQRGNKTNMYTTQRQSLDSTNQSPQPSDYKIKDIDIRETNIHEKSGASNPRLSHVERYQDFEKQAFADFDSPDLIRLKYEKLSLAKFKPGMQSLQGEGLKLKVYPFSNISSTYTQPNSVLKVSQENFNKGPTITGSPSMQSSTKEFGAASKAFANVTKSLQSSGSAASESLSFTGDTNKNDFQGLQDLPSFHNGKTGHFRSAQVSPLHNAFIPKSDQMFDNQPQYIEHTHQNKQYDSSISFEMRFIKQQLMYLFLKQRQSQQSNDIPKPQSPKKAEQNKAVINFQTKNENGDVVYFKNQYEYDQFIIKTNEQMSPKKQEYKVPLGYYKRLEEERKAKIRAEYLKKLGNYQERLLEEFDQVSKQIQKQERIASKDFSKFNIQEVFDNCLQASIHSQEAFDEMQEVIRKKTTDETVQKYAKQIPRVLKEKSDQKKQKEREKESNTRLAQFSLLSMMFGKSRDALVLKFIKRLKEAARERRELNSQKQAEEFVKDIFKQLDFNQHMRTSSLEPQKDLSPYKIYKEPKSYVDILQTKLVDQVKSNALKIRMRQDKHAIIEEEHNEIVKQIQEANILDLNISPNQPAQEIDLMSIISKKSQTGSPSLSRGASSPEQSQNGKYTNPNSPSLVKRFMAIEEEPCSPDSPSRSPILRPETMKPEEISEAQGKLKAKFVQKSLNKLGTPLPVLNRIREQYFPLLNYQLDENNTQSLASIFQEGIPVLFRKLYLMNNGIKDENLAYLIDQLSETNGMKGFGIITNNMGQDTCNSISNFVVSDSFMSMKKLILKDPYPKKPYISQVSKIISSLNEVSRQLTQLKVLTLSKLGFDRRTILSLGESVQKIDSLERLDISANCHNAKDMAQFLQLLSNGKLSQLKSLDISFNNCQMKEIEDPRTRKKERVLNEGIGEEDAIETILAHLLHYSKLIHLDISGTKLKIESLRYLALNGFRKSRTLRAVHMCSLNLLNSERRDLREAMRCIQVDVDHEIPDPRIDCRVKHAKVEMDVMQEIFKQEESSRHADFLANSIQRGRNKNREQLRSKLKEQVFDIPKDDQLIFQRIIGHLEIPDSHRWAESRTHDCHVCNKSSYAIIIWNRKAAQLQIQELRKKNDDDLPVFLKTMYSYSPHEPITFNQRFHNFPVLAMGSKVMPMLPVAEFIERLNLSQRKNVRPCNNELESARYESIKERMRVEKVNTSKLQPTFWEYRRDYDQQNMKLIERYQTNKIKRFWNSLQTMIPHGATQPINLQAYTEFLLTQYQAEDPEEQERMAADTFLCAMYLPAKEIDYVIKDPELRGVNYLRFTQPYTKHLSLNKTWTAEKNIRKVAEIRHFNFKQSEFSQFKPDSKKVLDVGFETDRDLSKINKFVKDDVEREQVFKVLRKYYVQLKDQFVCAIANRSYPVIGWLDFETFCGEEGWNIKGKGLGPADIDRLFIATNFEEEDLEENDDKSLVRFEFLEIITRMAKCKYIDNDKGKGKKMTLPEALEYMISNYIIPNSIQQMDWQEFRDNQLWTLEVDDLYKFNTEGLKKLFKAYASHKTTLKGPVYIQKDDTFKLLKACGLECKEHHVLTAYAMSMSTVADEMKDYDRYNMMNYSEFLEFIGRLAHLHYDDSARLERKIERLMRLMLPVVNMPFIPVVLDDQIPSDSDCDDDWVDEITQDLLKPKVNRERDRPLFNLFKDEDTN